ncbi:MAG: ATP-binding protein [Chloroflexi bacterium]|nr:ATP-binding protein [Chloroflexota bacterium]
MGDPLTLERTPTDLAALAECLTREHQRGAERHRIRLVRPTEPVTGEWDGARLERVIGNLLSNAVKYSPAGGDITVTVGREPGRGGALERAVLVVRDQGMGIPAADLPQVFERFHRGGNVVGQIAGTGIGLAGVRQIVEGHGGAIEVQSSEEQGTVFTVRLPLYAAPA